MNQCPLRTERLALMPRTLEDTDDCLAMDRSDGVLRYVDGPWHDLDAHRAFIVQRTLGPYPDGLGYWVIRDETRAFCGWVLLIPMDGVGPDVEIGWRLRPELWRRGYASEAARRLVDHGFANLALREIVADIAVENLISRRVAEKLGFVAGAPVAGAVRYRLVRSIPRPVEF